MLHSQSPIIWSSVYYVKLNWTEGLFIFHRLMTSYMHFHPQFTHIAQHSTTQHTMNDYHCYCVPFELDLIYYRWFGFVISFSVFLVSFLSLSCCSHKSNKLVGRGYPNGRPVMKWGQITYTWKYTYSWWFLLLWYLHFFLQAAPLTLMHTINFQTIFFSSECVSFFFVVVSSLDYHVLFFFFCFCVFAPVVVAVFVTCCSEY